MAVESRTTKIIHTKANLTMTSIMDKGPSNGRMEGGTRASFSKINSMVTENKSSATEFTKVYSKTEIPMELDSSPTLMV